MSEWLRIADIAKLTGLSRRHWQRCFACGKVPGARQIAFGRRRLFITDQALFRRWWEDQLQEITPCQALSEKGVRSIGDALNATARRSNGALRQRIRQSLESASPSGSGNLKAANEASAPKRRSRKPSNDSRQITFKF